MTGSARPSVVWVVASEETARRWARALEEGGHAALALPHSRIVCVAPEGPLPPGPFDRLLLTSANALRCLPPGFPREVPAACVGPETAAQARRAGLVVAEVGPGTGAELAEVLLRADPPPRRLLFARGETVRREGLDRLEAAGVAVAEVVVYAARPHPGFEAAAARALVVGSPRAAAALAALGRGDLRALTAAVLGAPTAEALAAAGFSRVLTAPTPDVDGLSAALAAAR